MSSLALPLLFGLLACIAIGFAMYYKGRGVANTASPDLQENANLKAQLQEKDKEIGKLTQQIGEEKTAKDELAGKGKAMFAQLTDLKAKHDVLIWEKEKLEKELTRYQTTHEKREKELAEKIERLDRANESLENEKKRIQKEDEERILLANANRDRMWNEHEERVIHTLSELCRQPQFNFPTFDNKNLPEGFSGKIKPDFMIEFLGQYVIFDAKVSKAESLQTYINDTVKKTAEKIDGDPRFYPMIFFIVPTESLQTLSTKHFREQGFDFFIISSDVIPVVLTAFKKISTYELADKLDPRDREDIVSLIAEFDFHINQRNAYDILVSKAGVSILAKMDTIKSEFRDEVKIKQSKMKLTQPSPSEIKALMIDKHAQTEAIEGMVEPKAQVKIGE